MVRTLQDMGIHVVRFDFREVMEKYSLQIMNEMLRTELANQPDIVIYVPFQGMEVTDDTWLFAEQNSYTILWLFNDCWRFDQLGKELCWMFDCVVSDGFNAPNRYREIGYDGRVLFVPRACRTKWFAGPEVERDIDVAFIGQLHGKRSAILSQIRNAFVGAPYRIEFPLPDRPRISWPDYIQTLKRAKIGLSLGESSQGNYWQLKQRDVEVPAAGAMLLADHGVIDSLYTADGAVGAIGVDEMIGKIRRYLEMDRKRIEIAKLGHQQAVDMHDYQNRFEYIFRELGF